MHFSTSVSYPAGADAVSRLWRNEEFQRAKAKAAGARRADVTIQGADDLTITIRAEIPADVVHAKARRFVGKHLEVTIVEAWQGADADGRRAGTLSLDIAGVPARVAARMELVPTAPGACTRTYDGDVKASVPLFGGPIEKAAVGAVDDVVAAEKQIALTYLDS